MMITLSALRCLGAVNAVSLYVERGGMTFDGVHVAVAARVARLARVNRVERLIPAISLREERPPLTNTPSHSCRAAPLPGMGLLIQTLISWTSSWASGDVINFKYETLAELRPLGSRSNGELKLSTGASAIRTRCPIRAISPQDARCQFQSTALYHETARH